MPEEPVRKVRNPVPANAPVEEASPEPRQAEEERPSPATEPVKRGGLLNWVECRKQKTDPKGADAKPEKPKGSTGDQHGVPSWLEQLNQRKREASMVPADNQRTAAVENGAKPVFTGNAVDEPIERVPIMASGAETPRAGGRLDGTAKEEMPSIRVVSDVEYQYPPIELLNKGIDFNMQDHTQEDQQRAQKIEETLGSFNIESKVMQIMHGPAITRFAIQIAPGIRVQRVTGMADNLALSLATKHVRVEAPIQGTNFIGIEVPNKLISTVSLREVLDSREMRASKSPLAVSLGKDIAGTPVICDLSKMPHLLIAGATGSGKSVCIHSIVCSLLYRSSPKEVRLIMVDPKQVELSVYNGVPHLLIPVVTDVRKASGALGWVVQEMQ
ncbi:MAG: DNA translocase FtsK, partial [Clostridia bacterium]|nr:DNA translocase FtsK [Clostridia bacterium]